MPRSKEREHSGRETKGSLSSKFRLSDAIALLEEFPHDTEEERWARFPGNMPVWDKMKFERNALVGIISTRVFDAKFKPRIDELLANDHEENVVFRADFTEQTDTIPERKGTRRSYIFVTEIPNDNHSFDKSQDIYLFIDAARCCRLELDENVFVKTDREEKLEQVVGRLSKWLFDEAVAQYIESNNSPVLESFCKRYKTLLERVYKVDTIIDQVIEGFLAPDEEAFNNIIDYWYVKTIGLAIESQLGQGKRIDFNESFVLEENQISSMNKVPGEDYTFEDIYREVLRGLNQENRSTQVLKTILLEVLSKYDGFDESEVLQLVVFCEAAIKEMYRIAKIADIEHKINELGSFVLENYNFFRIDVMTNINRISPNTHLAAGFSTGIDQINATYLVAQSIIKQKHLLAHPEDFPQLYALMNAFNNKKVEKSSGVYNHEFILSEAVIFVTKYLSNFESGDFDDGDVTRQSYDSAYFALFVDALQAIKLPIDYDQVESLVATNYHNLAKLAKHHLTEFNDIGRLVEKPEYFMTPGLLSIFQKKKGANILLNDKLLEEKKLTPYVSSPTFCPALPTNLIKKLFLLYQQKINVIRQRALSKA